MRKMSHGGSIKKFLLGISMVLCFQSYIYFAVEKDTRDYENYFAI